MENNFKQYRRVQISELREITNEDINEFKEKNYITVHATKDNDIQISVSDVDRINGSPKIGDMIGRNPKNHLDQWLVAMEYFQENFEPKR